MQRFHKEKEREREKKEKNEGIRRGLVISMEESNFTFTQISTHENKLREHKLHSNHR